MCAVDVQQSSKRAVSPRVARARERVLTTRPSVDLENASILTRSYQKTEGQPLALRKAMAFKEQCEQKTIFIQDGELIVGCPGSRIRGGILSPDSYWSVLDAELDTIDTRDQDPFAITQQDKDLFAQVIKPYWRGRSVFEAYDARKTDAIKRFEAVSSFYPNHRAARGPGELTAGYPFVVKHGIAGITEMIDERLRSADPHDHEQQERAVYLQAMRLAGEGLVTLAQRYSALATEMAGAEAEEQRTRELETIAGVCAVVPLHPPRNFWEGLQSVYFYHLAIQIEQNAPAINLGRMDQYLLPLYERDLGERGPAFADEAQELLDCLWVKFAEACLFQDAETAKYVAAYPMYQNVTCGGVLRNGDDAVNALSYQMMTATEHVRMAQPSLAVVYNKAKNPDELLLKAVDIIALGDGFPAVFNDDTGTKMMLGMGVEPGEAYDWNVCGCVEPNIAGKMRRYSIMSDLNMGAVIEYALLDGVNRRTGERVGVATGDPRSFETFGEFKEAVKRQLASLVGELAQANVILDEVVADLRPVPVISLSFEECVERGLDYERGGPKYSVGGGISMVGIADFINTLAAVKHLIYDERRLTWDELLAALADDFAGHEEVRQLCLAAPKYGNDLPEVDALATEFFEFMAEETHAYRGRHGRMVCGVIPVTGHVPSGHEIGALPTGRRAWTPLTDGISPTSGTDVNGPTAVLKSVSRIDHSRQMSGTQLNMRLDPELFTSSPRRAVVMDFIKGMVDLGVHHIQFNVVDDETLRAAQRDPEQHRGLVVRVAGYSAFFVELSRDIQDEIIARTTHGTMT